MFQRLELTTSVKLRLINIISQILKANNLSSSEFIALDNRCSIVFVISVYHEGNAFLISFRETFTVIIRKINFLRSNNDFIKIYKCRY